MDGPCILVTAIEPSADQLGARLIRALRDRRPQARFVGVGGPAMTAQGVDSVFDPSALAVVGAANALRAWPRARAAARRVGELARESRADVAVLIDAWGFSIRAAAQLRAARPGMPIVKYVAPQVWATRPGRARLLASRVDRLLTILPFDAPYFEAAGLSVEFVGNPALASERPAVFEGREPQTLLVLPGSRRGEVRRLMGPFGEAVARLAAGRPRLRVVVAAADAVADQVRALAEAWSRPPDEILQGEGARVAAMRSATAALACSGTVTTELAMAGCAMAIAYRLDPATHLIAKALIRTPYVALINVCAGRFVAPERIQSRCRGDLLAADLAALLDDPARRDAQARAQYDAACGLRGGIDDPVGAAADAVVRVLAASGR